MFSPIISCGDQDWFRSAYKHILSIRHWYKFTPVIKFGMHVLVAKNLLKAVYFRCLLSIFTHVALDSMIVEVGLSLKSLFKSFFDLLVQQLLLQDLGL